MVMICGLPQVAWWGKGQLYVFMVPFDALCPLFTNDADFFSLLYHIRRVVADLRKVNTSNKTLSWLSAQSYGAYIVHLPLMICIQNVFDGVWMGAFGKFVFVGVVTTVLSFALTWLLRLLPGVKRVL